MNRFIFTILFLLSGILSAQTNKLLWKTELKDDVKMIKPVQNGKYLFLWSDEYAWLYENATGRKVWNVVIDEYSEKAFHQLVNDSLYLVANEDTLLCYNIVENKLSWKRSYQGIQQDRFSGNIFSDTVLILSFRSIDLGINLLTGKEIWRTPIAYQKSLIENGTVSSILFDKAQKYMVFAENDDCCLISSVTGKRLLTLPKSEPNSDLIKQKRAWFFVTADQKYATLMFDKNVVVIDIEADKIVAQRPVSISDQYNIFLPTAVGCAVFGEEKVLHINYSNGAVAETKIDIDEIRNVVIGQADSALVMVISQENAMVGLNLSNGKVLWQTPPKYQIANGFIHRFVVNDSNRVIVTYLDPSDDLKLYLMGIDLMTGKINFRTFIAHADESLPKRQLPLAARSSVTESTPVTFGYDDAGFTYTVSADAVNIMTVIHTSSEMIEPNSKKAGGEGVVLVDRMSGSVIGKNYMKIADGLSLKGGRSSLAPPMKIGNIMLLPGNKNLVALDATTGILKWMHIEQDLNGSYVFDMALIDSILYLRTGGFKQDFSYDQKKEKLTVKKLWEEDGYMLLAVDTSDGKIIWKKEFDSDPGRIFHDYSIMNYSSDSSAIFYGDEKFLYSISSAKKGKLNWKFEFSDSGIGKLNYDILFRQSIAWTGERSLNYDPYEFKNDELILLKNAVAVQETLTTVVSKVLHVNYSKTKDRLIVFGEDGIASVNPVNGKRAWYYEWDYNEKAVHHRPMILKNNMFFCVDGMAVLLNIETGKVVWQTKVDKDNALFIMPDRSSVIAVYKDVVNGFIIP